MSYTLINIYNLSGGTLFNDIVLPDEIDKEILINSIFDECDELEPITSNPLLLKAKIDNFFLKNKRGFEHLIALNALEYNPIENTDRYEEKDYTITRTDALQDKNTKNLTDTTTPNITATEIRDLKGTNGGSVTTENKTSAYNSSDYQPEAYQENNQNLTSTDKGTIENKTNGNSTYTQAGTDTTDHTGTSESHYKDNSYHVHGNIGVTTNQQMMTEEVDFWTKFNVYQTIAQKFMFELCITVM